MISKRRGGCRVFVLQQQLLGHEKAMRRISSAEATWDAGHLRTLWEAFMSSRVFRARDTPQPYWGIQSPRFWSPMTNWGGEKCWKHPSNHLLICNSFLQILSTWSFASEFQREYFRCRAESSANFKRVWKKVRRCSRCDNHFLSVKWASGFIVNRKYLTKKKFWMKWM